MKRSGIREHIAQSLHHHGVGAASKFSSRGDSLVAHRMTPDSAALHPGYDALAPPP